MLNLDKLDGSLPNDIFWLQNLLQLHIHNNHISGLLSDGLSNFSKANVLDSQNQVCNSDDLEALNDFQKGLTSGIESCAIVDCCSWDGIVCKSSFPLGLVSSKRVVSLELGSINLKGSFSESFVGLNRLRFTGNLPDVFTSLSKLESFSAHSNYFIGRLPFSLSNSSTIETLGLRNNSLSGPIDLNSTLMVRIRTPLVAKSLKASKISNLCLSSHSQIQVSITLNFLGEEIPTYLALQFKSLEALMMPYCGLTGLIPQWLSNCNKLQLLDLSWNYLGGKIPDGFSALESLFYIDLSNNSLSGDIPKSLTRLRSLSEDFNPLRNPYLDIPLFKRTNQYNKLWRKASFPPTLDLSCLATTILVEQYGQNSGT
ncbi:Leucine-rich repeat receptor-like protein kinase pepr2 [Thalictrum thalictroides]|uniref:Leucine-rich repeat receptor-like protein kinase pepr2 n=1 Tax=Thalictrum thalictroides TaxID=46969 RepID=A0A7J6XDR8_THATH|nr:Leucine-rich repeat receptor-like protein kinase pepr2 [Thalictrum thalictroides]